MRAIVLSALLCLQFSPVTSGQTGYDEPYPWKKLYAPEVLPNWLLFGVAVLAARAALKTLRAIEDQVEIARGDLEATRAAADAAKRSADIATQTLHLTERADLLYEGVNLDPDIADVYLPHSVITMKFTNFGRTRADEVSATVTMRLLDKEPLTTTVVGPAVTGSLDALPLPFPAIGEYATDGVFRRLLTGEISLWLEGEVAYKDVFGAPHRTVCVVSLNLGRTRRFEIERKEAT